MRRKEERGGRRGFPGNFLSSSTVENGSSSFLVPINGGVVNPRVAWNREKGKNPLFSVAITAFNPPPPFLHQINVSSSH
jgi:hypothetical protein